MGMDTLRAACCPTYLKDGVLRHGLPGFQVLVASGFELGDNAMPRDQGDHSGGRAAIHEVFHPDRDLRQTVWVEPRLAGIGYRRSGEKARNE